jgi:hypothetical protein
MVKTVCKTQWWSFSSKPFIVNSTSVLNISSRQAITSPGWDIHRISGSSLRLYLTILTYSNRRTSCCLLLLAFLDLHLSLYLHRSYSLGKLSYHDELGGYLFSKEFCYLLFVCLLTLLGIFQRFVGNGPNPGLVTT